MIIAGAILPAMKITGIIVPAIAMKLSCIMGEKYGKAHVRLLPGCTYSLGASAYRAHTVYLSTPVLMHGGLLCTAFCLSVRNWTKIQTGQTLLDQNSDRPIH